MEKFNFETYCFIITSTETTQKNGAAATVYDVPIKLTRKRSTRGHSQNACRARCLCWVRSTSSTDVSSLHCGRGLSIGHEDTAGKNWWSFMETGRFDHVAVYSGLRDRRRNSLGTPSSFLDVRFLSLVWDYAQKAREGKRKARLLEWLVCQVTLVISSQPTDNTPMVRMCTWRGG